MLLPSDADIVNRDRDLPGLSLLLDPEALVTRLRSHLPDFNLEIPHSYYLRYKPRTNCLVAYQLPVNGELVTIYAKAFCHNDLGKLQKWFQRTGISGPLGPGRITFSNWATVVTVAPNDAKIKGLPYIAELETHPQRLRKLFPQRPEFWTGKVASLRYKPERRYVAQLLVQGQPQALLKVYTPSAYGAIYAKISGFCVQGNLCLAQYLASSSQRQILAFEWLPGHLLSELISAPNWNNSILEATGAAIAELHSQNPPRLPSLKRQEEAQSLLSLANWLGFIYPPLGKQADHLARQLAETLLSIPALNCPIHGDFYPEQVLLMDDMVGILDLDRAIWGDPAADLGNFVAHLERQALYNTLAPQLAHKARETLLSGYKAVSSYPIASRLNLYIAISLFRLLPEPFRSRHPHWPERTALILKRVKQILLGLT